jgi:hypothetical protein
MTPGAAAGRNFGTGCSLTVATPATGVCRPTATQITQLAPVATAYHRDLGDQRRIQREHPLHLLAAADLARRDVAVQPLVEAGMHTRSNAWVRVRSPHHVAVGRRNDGAQRRRF